MDSKTLNLGLELIHVFTQRSNKLLGRFPDFTALPKQITSWPSTWHILLGVALLLALNMIFTLIHRLYINPLASFPGPKLAASSRLYEFYYQGIKRTEFPDKIKEMHRVYGPIVRISPFELSINDSEFNANYFLKDRKLDKDPWYYGLGFTESLFTLLDKDKHRQRQGHLAPSFSGAGFQKFAGPIVERELARLLDVAEACSTTAQPIDMSVAFRKMGNEILRGFLLGKRGDPSAPADYMLDADVAYQPVFKTMTYVRHFPFLYRIHAIVPGWVYGKWLPLAKYQRDAEDHIRSLVADHDMGGVKSDNEGLLYDFVEQDPSYRDDNLTAAVEEFTALQWGGREVLGHGMTNIAFHLINNPECMLRLHEELKEYGIVDLHAPFAQLQDIPYLRAVCKEGLRMQLGGGFRIPRTNKEPIQYRDYLIPAQTPISMCPKFFHDDEHIFPFPDKFLPERWLQPDSEELDKYWKPFGNGSRSCIGMSLALEVVYRTIANLFLRYELSFHEIDADFCRRDGMLKVFPHKNSRGLTVRIRERSSFGP